MDSLLLNTTPSPDSAAGNHQTPNPLPKLPGLPTDFGARRPSRAAPRPPEHLPCPRCDSPNTKFCYYNNYNLSQPRHFCKSCRRYWTHGGALRDVPVGGGTRKSASAANKRSRRTVPAASKSDGTQVIPFVGDTGAAGRAQTLDPDPEPGSVSASCFWSNEEMGSGGGGFPFNGYPGIGLGLGPGYEQTGLDWPIVMEQVGVGDGGPLVAAGESAGCDTWRIGGGGADGSAVEGDYFLWPDLAISTPAANPSSE